MSLNILLLLLLVSGVAQASPPLQVDVSSKFEKFEAHPYLNAYAGVRLSQDLNPIHYDIVIRPIVNLPLNDPQQFTAPGTVTIRLGVVNPTDNITVHSNEIDIDYNNVQVRVAGTSTLIPIINHLNNSAMSTYTVIVQAELDTNLEYELAIPFTAKVGDRLSGLYRSSYLDADGNQKWLATTQFQKLGARMAFPCFDEPTFKSTFNITIIRPQGYHSLTNAPLLQSVPIPGLPNWFWDVHEVTVKMSTYLIAIIVSDFASVAAPSGISNYDVKVWGPPTMTDNDTAIFAATSAAQIVNFFETYFDSPFQFSKLDSAAIPDFSAGAMENWAMNTYRLNYMLFINGESTQNDKWGIARVIAHEISHHWFGDLVTCNWWNDLWLNEGFASYMELVGGNATGFDIDAMDRYPVDKLQVAMEFDVTANTEPIHSNNTEINNSQSSTIIYQKASSIIRMFQSFLTEETFISALRKYLKKYEYSNTVQDNLFAELQSQADLDGTLTEHSVKEILDSWTLQTGFPIVSVTWFPDHILFRHEKFSTNPPHWDDTATQEAGSQFTPIAWTKGSNPDFSQVSWKPQFWFQPGIQNNSLTGLVQDNEWIIVNPDARSYFRTIYCSHFRGLLITQLESDPTVISANTRSQIIDDLFKTAYTNGWENAQIENALSITNYLDKEDNLAVWLTVFNNLRPIKRYLTDTPFYDDFKAYILSKITPPLNRIGWEQDTSEAPKNVILRTQLLDWSCSLGSQNCSSTAEKYGIDLASGRGIPADLHPIMYCKLVSMSESLDLPGQFSVPDYLVLQYQLAIRAERATLSLNALACVSGNSVESWLSIVTSATTPFTYSDSITFLQRLSDNSLNRELILDYFSRNLASIVNRFGDTVVSSVVSSMSTYTSDAEMIAKINTFIDTALEVVTSENVRNSLIASKTTLENNVVWVSEWGQKIGNWLQQRQ